jgi:hypothetical protein
VSITLTGVLVAVVAILPGLPGDRVYRLMVGSDWREDSLSKVLRLLGFSLFGLAIYATVHPPLGLPAPLYLFPATYDDLRPESLRYLLVAILGHFVASTLAGLLTVAGMRILASVFSLGSHAFAWDQFIRVSAKGRWVIIGLSTGESYAGFVKLADISVAREERDLILSEPCGYDEENGQYRALEFRELFLPGNCIVSVSTLADETENRFLIVNEVLGTQEVDDGDQEGRKGSSHRKEGIGGTCTSKDKTVG